MTLVPGPAGPADKPAAGPADQPTHPERHLTVRNMLSPDLLLIAVIYLVAAVVALVRVYQWALARLWPRVAAGKVRGRGPREVVAPVPASGVASPANVWAYPDYGRVHDIEQAHAEALVPAGSDPSRAHWIGYRDGQFDALCGVLRELERQPLEQVRRRIAEKCRSLSGPDSGSADAADVNGVTASPR